MKNLLESFAILLVGILSLAIVFFIVQYNLIKDDNIMEEITFETQEKKENAKEKATAYLSNLEGYGDDTDVKVDATKESSVNKVIVKSELRNDEIGAVVEDKTKTSYMENLSKYTDDSEGIVREEALLKALNDTQKELVVETGEPEKLPYDEIVDEIGMAIDAALDDL